MVEHDTPVIDPLVEPVVDPFGFRHRKPGQLLLDGYLSFYVPEVVGFEPLPFLRGILRVVAVWIAVPVLGLGAKIADEVFALLQLLLFQTEDGSHTLQ